MKNFVVVVIPFLGIAVVAIGFSELETIVETLQRASLRFFFLDILVQLLWFYTIGRMYQSIFHLLGVHEWITTLGRIALAANFVNVVAPAAGVGGVALFASEARRRGHPAGKATVGAWAFRSLEESLPQNSAP